MNEQEKEDLESLTKECRNLAGYRLDKTGRPGPEYSSFSGNVRFCTIIPSGDNGDFRYICKYAGERIDVGAHKIDIRHKCLYNQ